MRDELHQDFLGDVFGIRYVIDHLQSYVEDVRLMLLHQIREAFPVAMKGCRDKLFVPVVQVADLVKWIFLLHHFLDNNNLMA